MYVIAGVRSARLLSWQERLAALRELLLWDHALWLGLGIYTAAQPHHSKVPAGTCFMACQVQCAYQNSRVKCMPIGHCSHVCLACSLAQVYCCAVHVGM